MCVCVLYCLLKNKMVGNEPRSLGISFMFFLWEDFLHLESVYLNNDT